MALKKVNSYTTYDYDPYKIVPVIASFDNQGHLKPLYVRIDGKPLRIESSWEKTNFVNYTVYHCTVTDNDIEKPLILSYVHDAMVWTINPGKGNPAYS